MFLSAELIASTALVSNALNSSENTYSILPLPSFCIVATLYNSRLPSSILSSLYLRVILILPFFSKSISSNEYAYTFSQILKIRITPNIISVY